MLDLAQNIYSGFTRLDLWVYWLQLLQLLVLKLLRCELKDPTSQCLHWQDCWVVLWFPLVEQTRGERGGTVKDRSILEGKAETEHLQG
jgi:hypothetical protein